MEEEDDKEKRKETKINKEGKRIRKNEEGEGR